MQTSFAKSAAPDCECRGGTESGLALVATLNEETNTLIDIVEPFLLKTGFVIRTPAGRSVEKMARAYLGYVAEGGGQQRLSKILC
ncbi:MAG: Holliday junction ATP-dependent DNA helicase RuvB [Dehalococcoidia bacterium]|nr:Holliday junction ATP-dependent DNA helicase RuvB [Bacillota bacterium]